MAKGSTSTRLWVGSRMLSFIVRKNVLRSATPRFRLLLTLRMAEAIGNQLRVQRQANLVRRSVIVLDGGEVHHEHILLTNVLIGMPHAHGNAHELSALFGKEDLTDHATR